MDRGFSSGLRDATPNDGEGISARGLHHRAHGYLALRVMTCAGFSVCHFFRASSPPLRLRPLSILSERLGPRR